MVHGLGNHPGHGLAQESSRHLNHQDISKFVNEWIFNSFTTLILLTITSLPNDTSVQYKGKLLLGQNGHAIKSKFDWPFLKLHGHKIEVY